MGIVPQDVTFTADGVVVSFLEEQELNLPPGSCVMLQQISVPGEACKPEIDELLASVQQLVDEALLQRRNPAPSFRGPR